MKVKVKRGKMKIKLKSGDESLPLSAADIRVLLASSLASALATGDDHSAARLTEASDVEPARLVATGTTNPATDVPES